MLLRTALSLVNLVALTATLVVWFAFPQFSSYALYLCLGWVLVAFGVMYSRWGNHPIGASQAAAAGPGGSAPLPAASPAAEGVARASFGFCIYCAANLPTGALRCPECGRSVGPL